MHVLISCVGSAGDVHPFLAIGSALQRRGHAVEIVTSPHFRARVDAAGLGFVGIGDEADFDRVVRDPALWQPRDGFEAIWREMAPRLLDAHRTLVERSVPGRTVLVGSTLAWAVRLAQETHGIAAATVHLSPTCILSAEAPPVLPGGVDLARWPAWGVRALLALGERFRLDRKIAPAFDRVRAALGLAPVRRVMSRWIHSPQQVLCAWPEWFAPRQRDWPRAAVTTGFPRWPAPAEQASLAPALQAFLDAGPAPIAFTPGSAMAQGRRFFEHAFAAAAELGARALFITPYADALPPALQGAAASGAASVHVTPYAPFDRLLPQVRALVHHGGIGTCAEALAAGVPQLVTPFAHDQFDNAARLVRLGVARQCAPGDTVPRWTRALASLLADRTAAAACERGASRMADDAGAPDRIANHIERLCV